MKSIVNWLGILLVTVCLSGMVNAAQRKVVAELFTSTTCSPCYAADVFYFQSWLPGYVNAQRVITIAHHVWWPSPGNDPMYLANSAAIQARSNYYQPTGGYSPRAFIDGLVDGTSAYSGWPSAIDGRMQTSSPIAIVISGYQINDSLHLVYRVTAETAVNSANWRVHCVLTEDGISASQNSPGGYVPFTHESVNRAMYPDATGESITISQGQTVEIHRTIYMQSTWVANHCRAVVFVQNNVGKEIINAEQVRVADLQFAEPVAYFPFNGNANDASGNGNNGTVYGATLTSDRFGMSGSAYEFDGINDWIQIPNNPSLQITSALTVAAWVYPTQQDLDWNSFVSKLAEGYGAVHGYDLRMVAGHPIFTLVDPGGTIRDFEAGTSPIPIGQWSQLVGTYDGSTVRIFMNGVQIYAGSQSGNISVGNEDLFIGKQNVTSNNRFSAARIDDVRLYGRALSLGEIDSLFHENGWMITQHFRGDYEPDSSTVGLWHFNESYGAVIHDASGHENNGLAIGAALVSGRFGLGRALSQTGEYVIIPDSASLRPGRLTAEAWVYSDSYASVPWGIILSKERTSASFSYRLQMYGSSGRIYFATGIDQNHGVASTTVLQNGNWYHVAGIFDGESLQVYINGVLEGSAYQPGSVPYNSDALLLGRDLDNVGIWRGVLDEVRVSNRPRGPYEFNLQLPPRNLTATSPVGAVRLEWQSGGGGIGLLRYRVYRSLDSLSFTPIDSITAGVYLDSSAHPWTEYYYFVAAVDSLRFESRRSNCVRMSSGLPTVTTVVDSTWNLISLPVDVINPAKSFLYPTSTSDAFLFDHSLGYLRADYLHIRDGYWLKFSAQEQVTISGTLNSVDTIPLQPGWNLIGTISEPVPVISIRQYPPTIVASSFYGYHRGYIQADTVLPGLGYWVKANSSGALVLSSSLLTKTERIATRFEMLNGKSSLSIRDAVGNMQVLYLASCDRFMGDVSLYQLPPLPPAGGFDARFATDRILETGRNGEERSIAIQVTSAVFPMTISWEMKIQPLDATLAIGNKEVAMIGAGSFVVTDPQAAIALKVGGQPSLPKEFALLQNYPNPFNPVTTIKYDLPKDSRVSLRVFDVLGKKVATLVSEDQKAGFKSTEWNAAGFASGVYFYRLQAGDYTATKKLLLLR